MRILATLLSLVFILACSTNKENNMQEIAEKYVKLVLKVGQYDSDVVDAYHGPEEWKPVKLNAEEKENFPKDILIEEAKVLIESLNSIDNRKLSELENMRKNFLLKQFVALKTKIEMIGGKKFKFDEESKLLYDSVAPHHDENYFSDILSELDKVLPGKGEIAKRYEVYRAQFIIPTDLLDTVFTTAISEGRRRTLEYIELPSNENFVVEYVKDKPWGAYNWYKGDNFSVIQVNTDLPVYIDGAVDLACHEGYPGHHVFSALLETNLLKGKNWVEYYVYPLFSPTSLIAEGTANYGIKVAFPGEERVQFEKEILFPLAGIDTNKADKYYEILHLVEKLGFARNTASRKYYDGEITKEEMKKWLIKYSLLTEQRAEKSVDFLNKYGSYIINYNYGQELCKNYIKRLGGTDEDPSKRWQLFTELISNPYTPSDLK